MGNHRADRRGLGRRPSDVATPAVPPTVASTVPTAGVAGKRRATKAAKPVKPVKTAKAARTATTTSGAVGGKRVASRHASGRGPLFRGLPSPPVLLGVAALAISAGGALTAAGGGIGDSGERFSQASALSGASDVSRVSLLDRQTVSRDSRRDALEDAADAQLVEQAESQLKQRDAALAKLAQQAEQVSAKLRLNQWVLPVDPGAYHLTARFGEYSGLWSHFHTGLDFAAPTGTPIHAVANGVVTSVGYDGSYGNKTVVTLDDGTELWYCHQNSYSVSVGDEVHAGDVIGYVGSTGNVTGPHLHLEVRPGAGDPVDPYDALIVHGLHP